jgi:hypothetical protein
VQLKPQPLALDEFAVRAFEHFAEDCRDSGHAMCEPPGSCDRALDNAKQRSDFDLAARQFDLGSSSIPSSIEPPAHTWPSSALLRVVTQTLFEQPAWSRSAPRRTLWLTSALARLGERGIPADAIVRTYFGTRIRRDMVIEIVGAYSAVKRGRATLDQIPPTLRDWFPLIPESSEPDELLAQCLSGPMSDAIDDWIQHGALAHVIGWKRKAEFVDVDPEDRVVQGGVDATRWLIDRFTRTMLDDWSRSSLDWELAYLSEPEATARAVGVAATLISERPVSESMVIRAIARRTREPSLNDEVFGGMIPVELMENVIALTLRDERSAALELARKALEFSPLQMEFEQAVAFLLIPDNPTEAERRLTSMHGRRGAPEGLLTACLITCKIRLGLSIETLNDLRDLSTGSGERGFWLWTADSLTEDEPTLQQTSLAEWATSLLALIHH